MPYPKLTLEKISDDFKKKHNKNKVILTFHQFLELIQLDTKKYLRNAADYISDTFNYYNKSTPHDSDLLNIKKFNLFNKTTERNGPIIGGEQIQDDIYNYINKFKKNGFTDKLILLHGPNGSAKTSTIEKIAHAIELYSQQDEGAVYKFNWIFPNDTDLLPKTLNTNKKIGFNKTQHETYEKSFAFLSEKEILTKIDSEYRENPLFLIPKTYRKELLQSHLTANKHNKITIPQHILNGSLSKKNKQIFECLSNAYNGDLEKVFQHIQIERFFFSSKYRIGISTVEPKTSIDAHERQVTMDKNYLNLPPVLQSINFHQVSGELVEANRGLLEFSDLLKRPIETFKYLLNTIETGKVSLASGIEHLDLVFIATTNDKHLNAFKTMPDFNSFKGRFELIPSPYLLFPQQEKKIYEADLAIIKKDKFVAPHSLDILCKWAVMTRLHKPNKDLYSTEYHAVLEKLTPTTKIKVYENDLIEPFFSKSEATQLVAIRQQIWEETQGMFLYEGCFGASPRDIKSLLYRAYQNKNYPDISPVSIFEELSKLTKNSSIYEYLQIKPNGTYHNYAFFIDSLIQDFVNVFESELLDSMNIINSKEYASFLSRYITHAIAYTKKEKIWDKTTESYHEPSQKIMENAESILTITTDKEHYRASFLSKIAAYQLENPKQPLDLTTIFPDLMYQIKTYFYKEKREEIEKVYFSIMTYLNNDFSSKKKEELTKIKFVLKQLCSNYHYNLSSIKSCLKFFLTQKNKIKQLTTQSKDD